MISCDHWVVSRKKIRTSFRIRWRRCGGTARNTFSNHSQPAWFVIRFSVPSWARVKHVG
jgi:hypothetical protein